MGEKKNLQGSITAFNTYHTDAYAIAVKNGFEGTEAEWLESLKGEKGDMPKGAVLYTNQILTEAQKKQARKNIGAVGRNAGVDAVCFDGGAQEAYVKIETGLADSDDPTLFFSGSHANQYPVLRGVADGIQDHDAATVRQVKEVDLTTEKTLTAAQKEQVRKNIGAASGAITDNAIDELQNEIDALKYASQTLTEEQKKQARTNIGAWGNGDSSLEIRGETQDENVVIAIEGTTGDRIPVLRLDKSQEETNPILRGISDGEEDHDAATVGQLKKATTYVDDAIANAIANLPIYNGEVEDV